MEQATSGEGRYCPGCGYDQTGAPQLGGEGIRACAECGLELPPGSLRRSVPSPTLRSAAATVGLLGRASRLIAGVLLVLCCTYVLVAGAVTTCQILADGAARRTPPAQPEVLRQIAESFPLAAFQDDDHYPAHVIVTLSTGALDITALTGRSRLRERRHDGWYRFGDVSFAARPLDLCMSDVATRRWLIEAWTQPNEIGRVWVLYADGNINRVTAGFWPTAWAADADVRLECGMDPIDPPPFRQDE